MGGITIVVCCLVEFVVWLCCFVLFWLLMVWVGWLVVGWLLLFGLFYVITWLVGWVVWFDGLVGLVWWVWVCGLVGCVVGLDCFDVFNFDYFITGLLFWWVLRFVCAWVWVGWFGLVGWWLFVIVVCVL